MSARDDEDVLLEGVLVPMAWGPSGEVTDVGLMTFDESEYRLDSAATRSHSLKNHLRKHVRLSGLVRNGCVIQVRLVEMLGSEDRGSSQPGGGLGHEYGGSRGPR